MSSEKPFALSCPMPIQQYDHIVMAHGGGGRLMHQLIEGVFLPVLGDGQLVNQHDASEFQVNGQRLAMTTDSYVVHPLSFPGGDIGCLAVYGTVNDLAMSGAKPLYLSAGFILEEGLPMEILVEVVRSMRCAADCVGVQIITGDTKVVNKGKGDGVFINTAGVGRIDHSHHIHPRGVQVGDVLIVNGDLGRHGIAIMVVREGLAFETTIESDSGPVNHLVQSLLDGGIEVHCLRDLTRGGLSSALNEIAGGSQKAIHINECDVPVREDVRGACELLGLDPLYVACEGRFVAFVKSEDADRAVELLRRLPHGEGATIIGRVTEEPKPLVTLTSSIGSKRLLDLLSGEQLPRIC